MSVGVIGVISMHTECSVGREVKAVLIGWKLGEEYSCMQRTCRRRNLVSLTGIRMEGTGGNFRC